MKVTITVFLTRNETYEMRQKMRNEKKEKYNDNKKIWWTKDTTMSSTRKKTEGKHVNNDVDEKERRINFEWDEYKVYEEEKKNG